MVYEYRVCVCVCVCVCDRSAPREMTKLTSGKRRRSSSRHLNEARGEGVRVGQAFMKTWHLQACGGAW